MQGSMLQAKQLGGSKKHCAAGMRQIARLEL